MSKDLEALKKGQTIERRYVKCGWCTDGYRREMLNCYDTDWVTCFKCKGQGQLIACTKIVCGEAPVTGAKNPFLPAKD